MRWFWRVAGVAAMSWGTIAYAAGRPLPVLGAKKTADVLMMSDLHFDPLSDPEKFKRLRAAPVEGWQTILEAPASSEQAARFSALQEKCKARGTDASWTLLRNTLQSARLRAPKAAFVTVGGDLLVHGLDCRVRVLLPEATETEVSAFAEKTVAFVALQMHRLIPGTPIYLTLGNNDSGCADYRETSGSAFLKRAGESFAADQPVNGKDGNPLARFSEYGDYSVALPAPMRGVRLIVLQDIFLSERYATCGGKKILAPDAAQIEWLRQQLEAASAAREHVWVMTHIPPGVDVYSSFHRYVLEPARMCEVKAPTMFLHTDALTETLASFPGVVQLALFAHTHMDEMKLLHKAGETGSAAGVAAKVVPSVSPVNGNRPAFLVAQATTEGAMRDYIAYTSSDMEGRQWNRSYSFRSTYGAADFSAQTVGKLTSDMRLDSSGSDPVSRSYRQWFLPGDSGLLALGLQQIWPAYSCAASETTAADFSRCLCPARPEKAPAHVPE